MKKILIILIGLIILAAFGLSLYLFFQRPIISETERDKAIRLAKELYNQKKLENLDMSNGPCLGEIMDDWVVDIAHNPRQDIDNLPENQCAAYRAGEAHHFVELDPQGNLIRAK